MVKSKQPPKIKGRILTGIFFDEFGKIKLNAKILNKLQIAEDPRGVIKHVAI